MVEVVVVVGTKWWRWWWWWVPHGGGSKYHKVVVVMLVVTWPVGVPAPWPREAMGEAIDTPMGEGVVTWG